MYLLTRVMKNFTKNVYDSIRFMSISTRRRIYYGTATVITTGITTGYIGLHTWWNDEVVEQLQMYKMKLAMQPSISLRKLLKETFYDLLDAQMIDRAKVENSPIGLFNFVGNELYSIGTLHLPTGAYIGVPQNYNLNNVKQLNIDDIRLLGRYRTKRSEMAPVIKQLFESSILSDSAKRYALAHELVFVSFASYLPLKVANVACSIVAPFLLAPILNRKLGFTATTSNRRLLPRASIGVICFFSFTLTIGLLVDQLLDQWYDLCAVKRLIAKNRQQLEQLQHQQPQPQQKQNKINVLNYIGDGGEEYYHKLIQRNCALYEMLGEHGNRYYTKDGGVRRFAAWSYWTQYYDTHLELLAEHKKELQQFQLA